MECILLLPAEMDFLERLQDWIDLGCNVKLYDEEGTAVVGRFLCHIHGV